MARLVTEMRELRLGKLGKSELSIKSDDVWGVLGLYDNSKS